jgi:membrane protease YdiL (CAAX protease family)
MMIDDSINPIYAYITEITMVFIPIIYSRVTHRNLRNYGLKATKKLLPQGIGLAIGIGMCLSLINSVSFSIEWIFISCLSAPVCEEFFFRGFIQTLLMNKLKGGKRFLKFYLSYGLMLTVLIFGVSHLLNIFAFDISFIEASGNAGFAIFVGFLIGYFYQETRSILTPILMHSCLNGLSLLPL